MLEGKRCAFVTTADHFSRDAVKARNVAIEKNVVKSFDLYDYKYFMKIFKNNSKDSVPYWNEILQFDDNNLVNKK